MAKEETLVIQDIRGGVSVDHPSVLPDNQVAQASNINFTESNFIARRNGSVALDSGLADQHYGMFRHTPTSDPTDDQLFLLNGGGRVFYRDSTLTVETEVPGAYVFDFQLAADAASLHGKMFIAGGNGSNRLHVVEGTNDLRAVGLLGPAAPTVADQGAGTYSGTRYFRIRFTVQDTGVTVLRSEPSTATTFVPNGTSASARVTRSAVISGTETHWEVEESIDNANFYRIATVAIATTTYDDSLAFTAVATTGVLSEDIGDYTVPESGRWLLADDDRLLMAGHTSDPAQDSIVRWSPQGNMEGVGNDERFPADIGSFIDLDGLVGGAITGMSLYQGKIIVFKDSRIYMLLRTNNIERAYVPETITYRYGAVPFSIKEGADKNGRPALYFVDKDQGPMIMNEAGIYPVAPQLQRLWQRGFRLSATTVTRAAVTLSYPNHNQVWFMFAYNADFPNTCWNLETQFGGIVDQSLFDGAYSAITWNNSPYVSTLSRVVQYDVTDAESDCGEAFQAQVLTKVYQVGSLLHETEMLRGVLLADPSEGVEVLIKIIRDYGKEVKDVRQVLDPNFTPVISGGVENTLILPLNDANMGELSAIQFMIGDEFSVIAAPWRLHGLAFTLMPRSRT